jgi:methionyl-tRNA formyltransferase
MNESIVFFGSGPVAAASLRELAKDFTIEAVITKPRSPHHKGEVPVLDAAAELDLPVLTATSRRELDELFATRPVRSRIAVLIDFGIIVSQAVIDYFELGIVNSHFSLLPDLRGADPITFAILSGQPQTGVSLMLLVEAMDEGPLLAQTAYDIRADETTPSLTEVLIEVSAATLRQILPQYVAGEIAPQPQPTEGVSYSRKLSKADSELDWSKPAVQLEREIRAFADWPKSRTKLGETEVVVTFAQVIQISQKPGEITTNNKKLVVGTSDGGLEILRLKPTGKSEMTAEAFLNGYRL